MTIWSNYSGRVGTPGRTSTLPVFLATFFGVGFLCWNALGEPASSWVRQIGSSSQDVAADMAVDAWGNVYAVGSTQGSLFGENPDSSGGTGDGFLTKISPSGDSLWQVQIGVVANDSTETVAVDSIGNVYVAGSSQAGIGGPIGYGFFPYLAKYDTDGAELWTKPAVTSDSYNISTSNIVVATDGSIYMTGFALGNQCCGIVPYVTKYDGDGELEWATVLDAPYSNAGASSIATDAAGNVYVAGTTSIWDLQVLQDAFLTKLDSTGAELWHRQFGTEVRDAGSSVVIDATGAIYVAGTTEGELGGPNAGGSDIYLCRWDADGNRLWTTQHGTALDEYGSISAALGGGTLLGGSRAIANPTGEPGTSDAIVGQFDANGALIWLQEIGTESGEIGDSAASAPDGSVYLLGSTEGSLGADNQGSLDVFLARFVAAPEPSSAMLISLLGLVVGATRIRL
jgi:hypothetical protein